VRHKNALCGALVLDLDGVIVDTFPIHIAGWKAVERAAALPERSDYGEFAGVGREAALRSLFDAAGRQVTERELTFYAQIKTKVRDDLVARLTPSAILPGVTDFIASARADGARIICLATTSAAATVLRNVGLASAFDVIASGVEPPKNISAAGLLRTLKRARCRPENALYVDDSPKACLVALAAGVPTVFRGSPAEVDGAVFSASTLECDFRTLLLQARAACDRTARRAEATVAR
jgi:beta-phosphoglucomutase